MGAGAFEERSCDPDMGRGERRVERIAGTSGPAVGERGAQLVLDAADDLGEEGGDGGALPFREAQRLRQPDIGGGDGKPLAHGSIKQPRVILSLRSGQPIVGHCKAIKQTGLNRR
jgi:hypothetical protein